MVSAPDRQSQRSYASQHRRRPLSAATKERSNANKTNALMIRHGPGGSGHRGRGVHSTVRITGACPPSRIRSTPGMPRLSGAGSAPATGSPGCELTSTPPIVMRAGLIVTSGETNPDCKKIPGGRVSEKPPIPQGSNETGHVTVSCHLQSGCIRAR